MIRAVYAGSFDPLTLGHLDLIERASKIFDEVVVAVVVNLEKNTMFSFDERMEMAREVTKNLSNVSVDKCDGLLAKYVNDNDFDCVIRGIRGVTDFEDERQMAELHNRLYKKAETVFLMPKGEYSFISSTMAKQVISLGGDGSMLVPPYVLNKMEGKLGK